MLTQAEVAAYLQGRGLVQAQTVVAGDLAILDTSRRNAGFKIISDGGPSYLLKQGVGAARIATVAHEAAIYERLHTDPAARRLRRYLPRLYLYHAAEHVLVLELLPAALPLSEYHQRHGRFSVRLAAALATALATLHRIPQPAAPLAAGGVIPSCRVPWVLAVHQPALDFYCDLSLANIQLIRLVQQFPEFGELLDELRAAWQPQALVHYDIKGENLLVARAGPGRRPALKLVDWELAGWGDPCWDVGAVFGEYLSAWLLSIPITGEAPPDRFLELARYPLVKIQPAMRRFWQTYVQRMQLGDVTSVAWLLKAVCYGAARLVQTALEQSQTAVQLTGNVLGLLQLSFNMLQRPQEAAIHLLGIPWEAGRSW